MLDILMSRWNSQVHIDKINESATDKSKIGLQYWATTAISREKYNG